MVNIIYINLLCKHSIYNMSDQNTIDYYLKTAWQSAANKYNQIASRYGITQAMGYVLINIHKEGTPVSQIANLLGVKTTSLSRMLNNLEIMGLIYRRVNAADKRSVKVFLTQDGVEKRKLAKQVVRNFNSYLESNLPDEERIALINALLRINSLAQSYNPTISTDENVVQLNSVENE